MRINHTDPWVRSDASRTSRTLGLQTTRSSGSAIHGRASDDVILRSPLLVVVLKCRELNRLWDSSTPWTGM